MIATAVAAIGAALSLYVLLGYPVLLALGRWRRAPAPRKDLAFQPPVSLILAVHNGGRFLRQKLESILALDYPGERLQILVVSDGSTDDTEAIAASFGERVELLRQPWSGKATAINTALGAARHQILFFTDVRQPLNREALRHLAAYFADPAVGAVSGELRLSAPDAGEQADFDLYWRYEVWVRRKLAAIGSIFGCTGCIYAIRRSLVRPLRPDSLSDDVLLPVRAFLAGYRVVFEPQAQAFDRPAAAGSEFRRRWRTLGGLLQAFVWEPRLFVASGAMTLHFLSHKFGRLLLPWTLLLTLAGVVAMPSGPLRTVLLTCAAAVLVLAVLDTALPAGFALKRGTSPPRTFLLMNAASLAAIAVFFCSPQKLWTPTRVAGGSS